MKPNQIIGIAIIVVSLMIQFSPKNPMDLVKPELPPQEKALLLKVQGLAPSEVNKLVASDLLAAANFIEMDQSIGEGKLSDSITIKDLKYQQQKMLWAHRIDLPTKYPELSEALYKAYEENLGSDFTPEKLINFNKTMAKVLNRA